VVGSFLKREEALAKAAKLDAEVPGLNAFVGPPAPGNPYFPVLVSDYLPYPEAKKVLNRVIELKPIDDAYLSPFTGR
jgi:hypothetical protein